MKIQKSKIIVYSYFRVTISFDAISSGDVRLIGFTHINYTLCHNSLDVVFDSMNQEVKGIKSFKETIYRQFTKNDKLILLGSLNTEFLVGEEVRNEKFTFELIHIQTIDPGEYVYSFDIPMIWLNVLLFITLVALSIIIYRRIKFIRFWQRYTEEDLKSDENYHDYIKKLSEEQRLEDYKKDQ